MRDPRRIPAISPATEVRADFPADPLSAGLARRFIKTTLHSWQCDSVADTAVLLVSELVANAVLHARTPIEVSVRLAGGRLRIEVRDRNAQTPSVKHYSQLATTGRGLRLVEQMASAWGVTSNEAGKSIWFELSSQRPPPVARLGRPDTVADDGDDRVGGSPAAGDRARRAGGTAPRSRWHMQTGASTT